MQILNVSVIGLGYIGLPTAAVIASTGINVLGIDVSQAVVDTINEGRIHIVEPDLDKVVKLGVDSQTLRASLVPEPSDVFMIAVPTPFKGDHEPDLSYVKAATESIAPVLQPGNLVILESTSPVGATEKVAQWLALARPDLKIAGHHDGVPDVHVAHCPERVLPGKVLEELISNDRIIGGITTACSEYAVTLYKTFVEGQCITTNARTAEMAKLTENSFRDVNIAFANELSLICDTLDINVWELIKLANHHPRVNILSPGPGVGGHCIAVDPWFIVDSCPEHAKLIRTARNVNDYKPRYVIEQVRNAMNELKRPVVACLGLAFKPDIDDLRESPALWILNELAKTDAKNLIAVEPNIDNLPSNMDPAVQFMDASSALKLANIVLVLVDHSQFKEIDASEFDGKIVFDTRGLLQNKSNKA